MKKNKTTIGIYSVATPIISIFPEKAKRAEKLFNDNGFKIIYGNLAFTNNGYTTGSPMERAKEINDLIANENIDILLSSIGGNNTSSILEYLDYEKIAKSNIKII
ncbi:MAG: LD-carboxypeptidase, partial [Metamycoplasmataceae bacterium]